MIEEKRIYIVGPNRMQNEMMAAFIESRTGLNTLIEEDLAAVQRNGRPEKMILFDCWGNGAELLLAELRTGRRDAAPGEFLAMFNLKEAMEVEKEALALGVRGFFYNHEDAGTLLKGIGAIFDHELWVSRRKAAELLEERFGAPAERKTPSGLTSRETEILTSLALGTPNETIAEQFSISPHTVKTHIYHIFRKIKVKNRIQAARWAMKHLF